MRSDAVRTPAQYVHEGSDQIPFHNNCASAQSIIRFKTFFVQAVIIIKFGTDPRGDFHYDNFLLLANSEITAP
jgi:hypothetical protein